MKLNNSMATAICVPRPFRSFFLVTAVIICLIHGFGTVTAQKVLNLTATGQNIKWYLTPTGGTPLDPSTDLVNNQNYYASQTVNGVESTTRLAVTANLVTVSAPAAGTHTPAQTQIAWSWNPVSGATGYKWGTTNVYASATDMGTTLTTTETGLTCNTAYSRYIWAYNASGCVSASTMITQATSSCSFPCGSTLTINHVTGVVAPVDKTVAYGTVTNIPGELTKCWITSNLGADNQAAAVNDATEPAAGWYWQFNRSQGYKHDGTTRTPNSTWITSISELSDWITANDPCSIELGASWRIPTKTEWYNVDNTGGWTSWTGPWGSGLKLHAAGYLERINGSMSYYGSNGTYWSSSTQYTSYGWSLTFGNGYSYVTDNIKWYGFSIRCIRDN